MSNLKEFSRQVVEVMPLMFREFSKREGNELTRGKISFPQMVALDYVSTHRKVKMTELSKVLSTQLSSTTVLVDRLIEQGFLSRCRDESDRRVVWVSATAKGKKVISKIMSEKRRSIEEIFKPLSFEEREQYLAILKKVKESLIRSRELGVKR